MSKYRRHVGWAAFLVACAVLAYVVFRPDSLEKSGPQVKPASVEKAGSGNSKPDEQAQAQLATDDDEVQKQAAASGKVAEQGAAPTVDSDSTDKASATAPAVTAKAPRPPKELFAGWEAPLAVLMLTGELHGYVEPCGCSANQLGGLSRRADLVRQIDERGWPFSALDLGGLTNHPNRRQGKFKLDMILKCLVDMRYAGVAMGIEELQLGFDFLAIHDPQKLPFLSANIEFFKDPKFEGAPLPSRIVSVGKLKIGVIAVFGPDLEEKARPGGQAAA